MRFELQYTPAGIVRQRLRTQGRETIEHRRDGLFAALPAAADVANAAAESPAQQRSQSHDFGIADFGTDLLDAGLTGFEKMYR
jgi:hypothetical protein